jgi:DNA-binding NtrC family response regulator
VRETAKPRVLFVDDERGVLRAIQRTFRSAAVEVHTAVSAEAALDVLAALDVQVVVSDQQLGDAQGTALLERVREVHPGIVRLLLTSDPELTNGCDALRAAGIFRLLHKPWQDAELREAVRQALAAGVPA